MGELIAYVTLHSGDLVAIVTGLVTVASIIAKLTPSESDNKVVDKIAAIVNTVAMNPKSEKARK